MAVLDKFNAVIGRKANNEAAEDPVTVANATADEKAHDGIPPEDVDLSDAPTENAQHGVRAAEAITLTWTKWSLVAVFIK
jgi:hypothetical protein